MIRWTTITVLIGSLIAGVLYDRVEHSEAPAAPEMATAVRTPELVDPAPLTADWYCPLGSSSADGFAKHTVYITNLSDETAFATVATMTTDGPGTALRLGLPARSTEIVDLSTLTSAAAVGAVIEVTGGEGVVSHSVETANGIAEGPCSTATASEWFFAGGITTRDAHYYVALLNPSRNAVVFSAEFQTETRVRKPKDLEAAVVPARSVRILDVSEFVSREQLVAAHIKTVQGHLVVERLQVLDGTLGPVGASLQLGVANAAIEWNFPAGLIHVDGDNKLAILNPTEEVAEVDLYLDPTDPADRASYGLLPREVTIAPGHTFLIDLAQAAGEIGLILPYELGVRVVSANGVNVVAERWHLSPSLDDSLIGAGGENARRKPDTSGVGSLLQDEDDLEAEESVIVVPGPDLVQPVPNWGVAMTRGVEQTSTRWVVPWVTIEPDGGTSLILAAGEAGASVEARLLIAGEWQPPIRAVVAPDGRVVLPIHTAVGAAPVLITSDLPIVVEVQIIVQGSRHDVIAAIPTAFRE